MNRKLIALAAPAVFLLTGCVYSSNLTVSNGSCNGTTWTTTIKLTVDNDGGAWHATGQGSAYGLPTGSVSGDGSISTVLTTSNSHNKTYSFWADVHDGQTGPTSQSNIVIRQSPC